jgi:hypothetical protein
MTSLVLAHLKQSYVFWINVSEKHDKNLEKIQLLFIYKVLQ